MNPPDKDRRKQLGRAKAEVLMPVPAALAAMPADYGPLLSDIKQRVAQERVRAVLSANVTMILLYWDIGQAILAKQQVQGWGARVIDRLAHDLKTAFPAMSGFSPRNWPNSLCLREVRNSWRAIGERSALSFATCGDLRLFLRPPSPKR